MTQEDLLRLAVIVSDQLGGGAWHWLNEAPMPAFNAALEYLGPLQASQDLRWLSAQSLMFGKMEEADRQEAIEDLQERARRLSGDDDDEDLNLSMEEVAARFMLHGWPVEIVD